MKELTGTKTWIYTKSGKRKCKARVAGKYLGLYSTEEEADVVIEARIAKLVARAPKTCRDYVKPWFAAREASGLVRHMDVERAVWRSCMEGAKWLEMEPKAVRTVHLQTWLTELSERSGVQAHRKKVDGKWVTVRADTGRRLSQQTLKKARSRAKLFFRWLKSTGKREGENPIGKDIIMPAGRRKRRVGTQRIVHLTADEIRALFDLPLPLMERAIFAVAIYTGLRKSELWALQWQNVDFRARKIYVREYEDRGVKTLSSVRDVTLLPRALEALEAYHKSLSPTPLQGLVFPADAGGMRDKDDTARWSDRSWRYRKTPRKGLLVKSPGWRSKAGIRPEVTFGCLRHTCACQLLQSTFLGNAEPLTIYEVSAWLGHTSIKTTEQHYAEYSLENLHNKVLGIPPGKVETKVETGK